jgi:integrating conjugative element protein (TIGR03761 family)
LRGVVTLTLETRQAQRLVKGRAGTADKPAIIGLIGFANLLRAIWHGARADDPYADWWLIKVHEALELADKALKEAIAAVQTHLSASEAIRATPGASVRPVRTPLRFSNPYAYRGAHLLANYDQLVRAVLTAQHIGVVTRADGERFAATGGRQLRRAFLSPLAYRLTGITRQDVAQGTAKSAQAYASMGEIPADVLAGALRAPHAPVRPMPASSVTPYLSLQSLPSKF